MNCEKFLTVAADLARNQMMDASERAGAQAHVDECDDCRSNWNDQLELSERLCGVADNMRASRAPGHVEAQLLAAFRDRTRIVSIPPASRRRRYWMSAAAAVALMVFGLLAWRSHVVSLRQRQVQASSNNATAPPDASSKQEQSRTVGITAPSSSPRSIKPVVRKSLSRRHPAASQLAKNTAAKEPAVEQVVPVTNLEVKEFSTDFVLVGYGNALDLQDGGQLIRVELPRLALARFGLPMNMDRADERIKADVLVGTDGLARAIRFVETKAITKD
jgi:hypothetical protein